jgi:2-haloacid dehalogenase
MPIEVVVFDVNETLSDMTPLRTRFADVGLAEHRLETWFAGVLRDGFALAAAGDSRRFADIAAGNLGLPPEATAHVLGGFADLDVHPDVPSGMHRLAEAGYRLVTLTNGAVAMSEAMFARAGVLDLLEHRLSVEDAGRWKPAPEPYRYAARVCGVEPGAMALVAVHPWDVHGAQRAGLLGAWVNRNHGGYPAYLPEPDVTVGGIAELSERLRAPDLR